MSEFTDGFLFRAEHAGQVNAHMQNSTLPFFLRDLNAKWSAVFIEDEGLTQKAAHDVMMQLSKQVSFMRYIFAEDHGWGYYIYAQGEEKAVFFEDYGLLDKVALDIAEKRLPEVDDIQYFVYAEERGQEIFADILKEAGQTTEYKAALSEQFSSKNVQAFANFNISSESIETLNNLLTPENIHPDDRYNLHQEFTRLLEITGMDWQSYHYISTDME